MFDRPDQVCNSHACEIGLVLRFIFQLSEEFRRLLVPEGYVRMSFTTLPSAGSRDTPARHPACSRTVPPQAATPTPT